MAKIDKMKIEIDELEIVELIALIGNIKAIFGISKKIDDFLQKLISLVEDDKNG